MLVEIRDYRGVERANIELSQIGLIAGQNEQGKSCIAEATRAALTGNPIPIAGVLKKDAKLLVRDGADKGHVCITDGEFSTMVCWPTATAVSESTPFKCSDYAAGFTHILDLDIRARSKVLAGYIKSVPTKDDVEKAAADAGYTEAAIAKIWESLENGGWDHTYKRARDYTITLKGQWQEATREKYGSKKGESYRVGDDEDRESLASALEVAEQAVLDTAGAVAVSESEVDTLKRVIDAEIENKLTLNDKLNPARDKLKEFQDQRAEIPDEADDFGPAIESAPCPDCGSVLQVATTAPLVLASYSPKPEVKPDEAKIRERAELRETLDDVIHEHEAAVNALEQRINKAIRQEKDAESAKTRLEKIEAAPKLDAVAVELAKDAVGDAKAALQLFEAKVRAYTLHGDLVKNDKLIGILAPDGLRKRKLADKLGEFNKRLVSLSSNAMWPTVRLDENLDCHYGTRPIWGASNSGQWRARTIIQVAMAQMDGSAAVILDEADMLDTRGRNGLFTMLNTAEISALVCMTFSNREKVPNLVKAKLGVSYWIEDGVAEAIA